VLRNKVTGFVKVRDVKVEGDVTEKEEVDNPVPDTQRQRHREVECHSKRHVQSDVHQHDKLNTAPTKKTTTTTTTTGDYNIGRHVTKTTTLMTPPTVTASMQ
jgi:hypothetical protein